LVLEVIAIKQFMGLVKKDWYWMRTEILLGLGFYAISLIILPLILQQLIVRHVAFHNLVIGMSFITLLLGMLLPAFVIIWLLNHDMKRPDIWLHTPASSVKLFAVKIVLSALNGIALVILTELVITLSYFKSGVDYSFSTMIGIELKMLAILSYMFLSSAFMGLIFWVLYQLLRPHLGKVSLVITFVLCCFYFYVYGKFSDTDLYKSILDLKIWKLVRLPIRQENLNSPLQASFLQGICYMTSL